MNDVKKFESRKTPENVPAVHQPDPFLAMVELLSSKPDLDVEKIKQLKEMQESILDRNAKQAFNAAMSRAQGKIELVVATAENKQTDSMYAKLKSILIQAKPIYTKEGFSLMFYEGDTKKENHKRICVDIMHDDGHTEQRWGDFAVQTTGIAGKPMMTQIHGEGSAFSYGRRYLTCAIFNIPTGDDDDGNAASEKPKEFITPDQAKQITDIIKEKNIDVEKWLTHRKIETVDTMPANWFEPAMRDLKKAKVRKAMEREPGEDE